MIYFNPPNLPPQNLLCLDLGTKKTGIAHNFAINCIATPYKTVETSKVFEEILLLQKNNFSYVIVGIPMAYEDGDSYKFIIKFVENLQVQLPQMNFIYWDETHSSQTIREAYKHGRKGFSKKFHENYDSKAAALILNSFLI